ncbi:MAG: DinB family protein [Longimicrobiaceae bacterium]
MLRSMVLNHLVHHRAQLGIYLRLVDLAVPMMYGPTADEGKDPPAGQGR